MKRSVPCNAGCNSNEFCRRARSLGGADYKLESSEGWLFSPELASGAPALVAEKALFFATNEKGTLFY